MALVILITQGCGGPSGGHDAGAGGASGHGGSGGNGSGGSPGSGGAAGAAGSGTAGSGGRGGGPATGGAGGGAAAGSTGAGGGGGSKGGAGGGGATGAAGSAGGRSGGGGSTGSGGAAGGRGGNAGSNGGGGGAGGTSPCQAVLALDRSCTTADDCFAGAHTTNCCGQVQVTGFRNSEKAQFQALEAACDATYPACGCAEQQPTADDGSRLRFNEKAGVTCVQGKCTSFVADCGQPCASGTTCFSCVDRNRMFAACTTMCADSTACLDPSLPLCQTGTSGNVAGKFCTGAGVACDTK